MTIIILLLTIFSIKVVAIDSDRVGLSPSLAVVNNRVAEPSGAAPFHIGKVHSARPVFFRPRSPDALLKRLTAQDTPNVPSAFSSANLLQKRHPGVHLTSLPSKASLPQAKAGQEESNIRKAPEWVEHLPTHSKHKFTIMNLGQSQEVIKQFYGGANGGKPYAIPTTKDVTQKSKRSDLDNEEANKIAEKIIKQELNRAKVAKFGKSAGNAYEGNESGPEGSVKGEGDAAAPSVEQSGYTTEVKAVEAEWSVNNNKVDEVLSGYSESTSVGEAAAPSPQNPSSSASSGPQLIPYALSKSVDGSVTGHGKHYCPPCALLLTSSPPTVASLAITAPTPPKADTSHSDSAAVPSPVMEGGSQPELLPPSPPVEVAPAVMPSSDKHEYSQEPSPVHVTVPAPQTAPSAPSPNIPPEPIAPEISTSNEQGVSSYKEEIAPSPVEPLPQPESGPATSVLPQTEPATAPPLQPVPSSNSIATGEGNVHPSQPLSESSPQTSATNVEPSPTQVQEKSSGGNYAVEAGASAPLQPSVHYTTTQSYLPSAPPQPVVPEERPAHTASQVSPTAFSSSYSAPSNVPDGGNSIGNGASASENSYSEKNEEKPASFSQILPAEAKPSESPAVAVLTTTQQAFVQQPDISLGESSYSNLEEDHTEIQAPPIPAPAPASTYIEEKSSHQFMPIPDLSVHPPNQQTHTESLPAEVPAGEATVSPQPELRPEAIIIPSTSTTPTLKTSDSDGSPHYINVSPSHGSDHSSSSSSQQVPYVPETAPAISEESEPEDIAPNNAEQSSYNDIEEDHEQSHGPPTIIDPGNTRNIPQVNEEVEEVAKPAYNSQPETAYNSQPKTAYNSQPKVAYNTQPKIQVNPAAYEVVRPYAPRPYQSRPVPQQPLLPPAPAPLPVFPQPVPPPAQPFPVYPIPQSPNPYPVSAPSYPVAQSPQGCCGGQLISSQGQLCMPISLDPCGGSRPQQFQRTDGGCGACSATCLSACQAATSLGCGSGNCCAFRSPSCCQPMQSLCCNQIVQSCCQPQQQQCCNSQNSSCCPSPLQSCCCSPSQISGLCRRSKRSIGRMLGLCGSRIR
uniref:Flocculation protein FLO11-like n=2 Tax=Haemonchus contortus TaxID=6289 RepID=A0A7I4YPG1_HAECO